MSLDLTKKKLEELYENLGSIREMAKVTGASPKTLSKEMKKFDIAYDRVARKYTIHHDFFAQDTEATFYWAGFVASGGNIYTARGYRIEFNISSQDKEHLEQMISDMGGDVPVKDFVTKKEGHINYHVRTVISSKYLVNDLDERFGITPRKKFIYTLPDWLMTSENVRHFIRGWTDGLGGFTYNHQKVSFSTRGTHLMIKQLSNIFKAEANLDVGELVIKPVDNPLEMLLVSDKEALKKVFRYLYRDAHVFLRRKKNDGLYLDIG